MATALPPPGRLSPFALAHVPGARGHAPRCTPLPGGTVNDTWRVDTPAGSYVLRLDGAAWRRPGVERAREYALHRLAAAAGLAPQIVAWAPGDGVLVSDYIEGEDWTPAMLGDPNALEQLGRVLARLHALPAPPLAPFDPLALYDSYLARASAQSRAAGARARAGLGQAQALLLAGAGARIVHGDLVHANLRNSGGRLWLLDWEYAQVADPAWDLGCLLSYHPQARPHAARLLAAAGLAAAGERVEAAIRLHDALAWAWHQAREGAGIPAPPSAN